MGTFTWPPAGTSSGHQWGLCHGHGQTWRRLSGARSSRALADYGSLDARTSAGRISGAAPRRCWLAIRAATMSPLAWASRAASSGNASKIQKVSASVLAADHHARRAERCSRGSAHRQARSRRRALVHRRDPAAGLHCNGDGRTMSSPRIGIIGAGAAGTSAARSLHTLGADAEVELFTRTWRAGPAADLRHGRAVLSCLVYSSSGVSRAVHRGPARIPSARLAEAAAAAVAAGQMASPTRRGA